MSERQSAENDVPRFESWALRHARENPGHRTRAGLDEPGTCDDCRERSPMYNLVASKGYTEADERSDTSFLVGVRYGRESERARMLAEGYVIPPGSSEAKP